MKTLKFLFIFSLALCFSNQTVAQLKIITDGSAKLGNEHPNNDYNNEVSIEAFGLNTTLYRPGARIAFGDYGSQANYGANAWVGEYGTWDSDALQVNGKNGIYFTTGGQSSFEVARLTSGGTLEVRGAVNASSSIYQSDERLKKNLKTLTNPLQTILQLRGITYDWKTDKEEAVLADLNNVKTIDTK